LEVEWLHARLPELSGRFECVVANLLATILMDEWEGLRTKVEPGGQLLVSGILEEQAMGFLHAVGDTPLETKSRDGWVAMRFSF
jgi:ribosomal protein L11 methylase PrmA